jgi:hypothetical protein
MPNIISNFNKKNNPSFLDASSVDTYILARKRKEYYQNILTYLDEYIYFNYCKLTDPIYGLNFQIMLPYYIQVNVGVSIPHIIYQRKYPDDKEIDPLKFSIVEENYRNGIYT